MIPPEALKEIVRRATDGDRASLGQLAKALQKDVYGLALRMLGQIHEAEDATQEILVRIITRLAQFDGQSSVRTWAYRVAVNYLLDLKKSAEVRMRRGFLALADELTAPSPEGVPEAEASVFIEEIKASCSLAMLQCLDGPHRAAFVLGQILELPGAEAASVLGISPELYRKRLQKARDAMTRFMEVHCGLVSDEAPCRCNQLVPKDAQRTGGRSFSETRAFVRQVERAQWALNVHRSTSPEASLDFTKHLMDTLTLGLTDLGRASSA